MAEVAYREFLIVRRCENCPVKVPEDDLRKKASHGSFEPAGLFGAFAAIRSVGSLRQGCKRWIEEQLAVRAKNRTRRSGS
jgi:hypothetical protein